MAYAFDHEKRDVYRLAIQLVARTAELVKDLSGTARYPRDQFLRSSQSIAQNIAEGNGKRAGAERMRYFEIARGSAMESAATLDVLVATRVKTEIQVEEGKYMLYRLVQMLTKMAQPRPTRTPEPIMRTRTRTSG